MQDKFITSLNVCEDVNSWVRVTHEIHENQSPTNNDDATVLRTFDVPGTLVLHRAKTELLSRA